MSLRKHVVLMMAAVVLLVFGGAFAYYYGYKDHEVRRIAALQQQLENNDLSRTERNALKTQLMRTVDEMNPQQRRELQRDVFRQQRERMLSAVEEYHRAPAAERVAILDRELEQWQRSRELFGGGGMRGRGGGPGGGPGNRPRQGPRTNRPDRGTRPDQWSDRSDRSDEQRTQFAEYIQALQARAEQRGIRFGQRGNAARGQGAPQNGRARQHPPADANRNAAA